MLNELNEDDRPKNRFKKNLERQTIEQPNNDRHLIRNSSKKCFDRIDSYIKTVLSRKKFIPLTYLESIEKELVDNFKEDAKTIYYCCLDSSYERLLYGFLSFIFIEF